MTSDSSSPVALDPEQLELVKITWQAAQANLPKISVLIFERIFQIAPAAKGLFSFMKEKDGVASEEMRTNAARAHAAMVIHLVGDMLCRLTGIKSSKKVAAVKALSEKAPSISTGSVDKMADAISDAAARRTEELGRRHASYGVIPAHYGIVKEAVLSVLAEQFPNEWTADVNDAWSGALDVIATLMISGMEKAGKVKSAELAEAEKEGRDEETNQNAVEASV